MLPHLGLAVGSEEGSIPSRHNRAQQRAQLTAHAASGTTMRADVAPQIYHGNGAEFAIATERLLHAEQKWAAA